MTKAIYNIDEHGNLLFDCTNHAGDHDACTIISALCNVLVEACFRADREPTIYNKGHVRIDIPKPSEQTKDIFDCVWTVIKAAERDHPEHIKLY